MSVAGFLQNNISASFCVSYQRLLRPQRRRTSMSRYRLSSKRPGTNTNRPIRPPRPSQLPLTLSRALDLDLWRDPKSGPGRRRCERDTSIAINSLVGLQKLLLRRALDRREGIERILVIFSNADRWNPQASARVK
jgi:hypothetical protein